MCSVQLCGWLHHNGHLHPTDYMKYGVDDSTTMDIYIQLITWSMEWGEVQKSETLQALGDFALTQLFHYLSFVTSKKKKLVLFHPSCPSVFNMHWKTGLFSEWNEGLGLLNPAMPFVKSLHDDWYIDSIAVCWLCLANIRECLIKLSLKQS